MNKLDDMNQSVSDGVRGEVTGLHSSPSTIFKYSPVKPGFMKTITTKLTDGKCLQLKLLRMPSADWEHLDYMWRSIDQNL